MTTTEKSVRDRKKKAVLYASTALILTAVSLRLFSLYVGFLGINTMDCIKGRYFFVSRLNRNIKDGDYFAFHFRGSELYPKGMLFIKLAACSPGEMLKTVDTPEGTAYYCGGRLLGYACSRRRYSRCPEHITYSGRIPEGCYFAWGTAPRAYDSRYYGLVCSGIVGRAYKIF